MRVTLDIDWKCFQNYPWREDRGTPPTDSDVAQLIADEVLRDCFQFGQYDIMITRSEEVK